MNRRSFLKLILATTAAPIAVLKALGKEAAVVESLKVISSNEVPINEIWFLDGRHICAVRHRTSQIIRYSQLHFERPIWQGQLVNIEE